MDMANVLRRIPEDCDMNTNCRKPHALVCIGFEYCAPTLDSTGARKRENRVPLQVRQITFPCEPMSFEQPQNQRFHRRQCPDSSDPGTRKDAGTLPDRPWHT